MDSISSELHKKGIGAQHKSASVITDEDEDMLWAKGSLGTSSPRTLQHTVFFYIGLQFCLRGVQEQYDLTPHQLSRYPPDTRIYHDGVYYQYTEFISKNNQHRFKDINSSNKQCRSYASPGRDRCLVKLLDTYLTKLTPNSSYLYIRPLSTAPVDPSKSWYTKQRVGINTIKEFVSKICADSGLQNTYSNHSLRATAITRMFNGNIPEKVIADKSGHRSIKGLRAYEKTSVQLEQAAGELINGTGKSIPKQEETTPAITEKDPESVNPTHTFSGTLNNCTINIHYNK